MSNFITYSLQIMLLQAFFLFVYQILFHKETFFKWNRFYLLGTVLFSFLVPFITIPFFNKKSQFVQLNEVVLYNIKSNSITTVVTNQLYTNDAIFYSYIIGLVLVFGLFISKVNKIWKLKKSAILTIYNENKVYILKNSNEAFTFLNFIFIGDKNTDFQTIFQHELIHRKKGHTLDLLMLEMFKIIFWFNPILYIFQSKLAEVHEFEVDAKVVQTNKVKYFESIINQIFQVENSAFTNNFFNQSLIKKRIVMLQKSKSKEAALVKYVLIVPMLLVSILFFSNCVEKGVEDEPKLYNHTAVNKDEGAIVNYEEVISFENLETLGEIPHFPTCKDVAKEETVECFNEQMNSHIKNNFYYPELAAKQNIQGQVEVHFVIDKDGKVQDIITKGSEKEILLQEEARRIMSLLPKFIPAKLNGKTVNVEYALPITFKLI